MTRLLPIAILAVAASGCGGGGGQLSAAEYREQANAICAKANDDLRALPAPQSPDELTDYVDDARPIIEEAVSDLEDLEPPDELQRAADRWNDQNKRALDELEGLRNASLTEIQQKAGEFQQINDEANRIASEELGLQECAED